MIPKIECCLEALSNGCEAASIIDGRTPHSLLLEIFTHKGCGTEIKI
jgi:acetylglutamate kinase